MSLMRQASVALTLALGVHVAGFVALPQGRVGAATQAAGEGGQSLISLAPPPEGLAALMTAWETPPAVAPEPATRPEPVAEVAPSLPDLSLAPMPDTPGVVSLPAPESAPKADAPPETPKVKAEPPAPKPKAKKPKSEEPKAEKPQVEKAAPPAQKAKGKGKGPAAGEGAKASEGTLSAGQIKSLTADWGAKIAAKIERAKRYPAAANGAKGRVVLGLTVGPDGGLRGVRVKKSSGNATLDAAAVATVKSAGRFAKAPKGVGETNMTITLRFAGP